jgi:hypothetical protein
MQIDWSTVIGPGLVALGGVIFTGVAGLVTLGFTYLKQTGELRLQLKLKAVADKNLSMQQANSTKIEAMRGLTMDAVLATEQQWKHQDKKKEDPDGAKRREDAYELAVVMLSSHGYANDIDEKTEIGWIEKAVGDIDRAEKAKAFANGVSMPAVLLGSTPYPALASSLPPMSTHEEAVG